MKTDIEIHSVFDLLRYLRGRPGRNPSAPANVDFVARLLHVEVWESHLLKGSDVSATLELVGGFKPNGEPNPSILSLNPSHHKEPGQRRLTIAHMLGHAVLHAGRSNVFTETAQTLDPLQVGRSAIEIEAQDFADELLMPNDLLRDGLEHHPVNCRALATKLEVPRHRMAIRLSNLNIPIEDGS